MVQHGNGCLGLLCVAMLMVASVRVTASEPPNVVLIMTDNHGAWTLGCYGNQDVRTPNIDRLAAEGTLFERAFASNPVCSPTRATLLTGLMPSQHGVHCFLTGGRLQVGPDARCTLDELQSLPEVLSASGYACGLVGKWHLGDNLHPQEGFDDYWITMPHGGTSTFYNAQVIENGTIRKEPEYLTDFWTKHAIRFLEQQHETDEPFFLFLSYNGPYALSRLLLREGQNRHAAYYADKDLPSFPREPTHPWQFSNRDYHNNLTSIRRVATEVSGVDDGVGKVMQTLQRLGLDDNTLVIFVADQGWVGGHGGFFGMGDHTRPVTARDGMMQIPMIWHHPGRVQTGSRSGRMVTNYDVMPSLLGYLGLGENMPQSPPSPGVDFSEELIAANTSTPAKADSERPIFYEFENLRCMRTEGWKYTHRHPNGPHELYDLQNDAEELDNLIGDASQRSRVKQMKSDLDKFFETYSRDRYDLWNGGGSQTRIFVGVDEELAQVNSVEPPPTPETFEPAKFNLQPGFTAELVAGPPLVTHPTLGCLDDRGRLFICNNAGVNLSAAELEERLPNSIRMLEDVDGDGRFDRSTVFADKMTYPMGGVWHDGALYVASPPYIWRLEDTDGDGVADVRDAIVKEFGYTGNAASIHGCFLGPDGRLYWCDGYHGHEFKDDDGNLVSKREGSYLFSCLTDGSDVRIHCGGGMDNPVEVDFTDTGDLIGTVNIMYSRPRVDALVHWLHGGAYPHRERVLEELKVTGDLLGPMHRFGHVAVSGLTRYRSGVMNHRWRDDFFVTFFNSGKIVRVETEGDGSSYRAVQREFLSGTSPDFHPTDVIEDADGSLLVVDTGGWFYRGCPTSQMSKPEIQGGIYRIRRGGMTSQVDPYGKRISWENQTDAQVIKLLNDTRYRVRQRAVDECFDRAPAIVPALSRAMRGDIRVRQNLVWALTRISGAGLADTDGRRAIRNALNDRDATIRHAACRSLATYPDKEALDALTDRLRDDAPPVRREAAKALGRIRDPRAIPVLIAALSNKRKIDRAEEHAIIYALIEIDDVASLEAGLAHPSSKVRKACLIALRQSESAKIDMRQVAELLGTNDDGLIKATVQTLIQEARRNDGLMSPDTGPTATIEIIAAHLHRWLQDAESSEKHQKEIIQLVSGFAKTQPVGELISETLTVSGRPTQRDLILDAIGSTRGVPAQMDWLPPLRSLLNSEDPRVVRKSIHAISALETESLNDALAEVAKDRGQTANIRLSAMLSVEGKRPELSTPIFELLLEMLDGAVPDESARAAQTLSTRRIGPSQLSQLLERLPAVSPTALRDLIRPFARATDHELCSGFLKALAQSRSFETLATHEFSDVIKRFPADLLPQANSMLDRLRQRDQVRVQKLEGLKSRVGSADASRGQELFFSEKSKCSACHRVGDRGALIGPDLSTIGANRSISDLLESIVFPSASIVRQYESSTVLTTDGQLYSGIVTRQSGESLRLQQQTGEPIQIAFDEIEKISPSAASVMPNGLDSTLNEEELADIVAWLRTLGK